MRGLNRLYQTISTELKNNILTITLNRPEQMNAYTYEMNEELIDAYRRADQNDDVRVIIVTGAGRAFCAGMDLSLGTEVFQTNESEEEFRDIGGKVSLEVYNLKKPVIAAINGAAVGIGATMTLPMDIRILKKGAKMGFVFGKIGIAPEAASGWFLPRIVGVNKAMEWVLTGRFIREDEAVTTGLIQSISDDPYKEAVELAEQIIQNTSATSNSFSRQLFWNMLGEDHPYPSHIAESKFLYWSSRNADNKEGIQAFLEKRNPNFPLKASDLPNFFGR